jgi:S-adenosylmethionine-diacylglycerol 3-amino-3-carboxypropyl transferase
MRAFIETLNYSSSNEDSRSETRALYIGGGDSVLCITGSGARPLDLLIEKPATIVSIDFNPCQNFLLELKMAAIRHLEYQEYLGFVGVVPFSRRGHVYRGIRGSLSADARSFWDNHTTMIEEGVIYQGRWERYFRRLARLVTLARPRLLDKLFSCGCIGDQSRAWCEDWDDALWRTFLRLISSRTVWKVAFGDPGFYRHVPDQFSIYKYLNKRFTFAFENILVRTSPFATLLFYGKYDAKGALPLYLRKEHYKTLRDGLPCMQIVTQSLLEYLEKGQRNRFQKYSLSDFASYTSVIEYEMTWKGIIRTATKGARICERQFLVKRETPRDVRPYVTRIGSLEEELAATDDSLFYTFVVAETVGANDG